MNGTHRTSVDGDRRAIEIARYLIDGSATMIAGDASGVDGVPPRIARAATVVPGDGRIVGITGFPVERHRRLQETARGAIARAFAAMAGAMAGTAGAAAIDRAS